MTSEQFAYWLQGFVELGGQIPTEAQWDSIKDHLKTVFEKVTRLFRRLVSAYWRQCVVVPLVKASHLYLAKGKHENRYLWKGQLLLLQTCGRAG